jgi:hypothetical protein
MTPVMHRLRNKQIMVGYDPSIMKPGFGAVYFHDHARDEKHVFHGVPKHLYMTLLHTGDPMTLVNQLKTIYAK